MAEKVNSKRAKFPRGLQRKFIQEVLTSLSLKKVAGLCGVSQRTIRDWRREKFLMDFSAVKVLCNRAKLPFPQHIKLKDRYWYTFKGAKLGWAAVVKKYGKVPGSPEYRKRKWFEWWEREGKHRFHPIINRPKPIQHPGYSKELAELVGIVLGDGSISQYQVVVTLHATDDKEYGSFVVKLIKDLFEVPVGIYPSKKDAVIDYVVSRVELVRFLVQLGLREGNKVKHQVDIPHWIKQNKNYSIACVRGLVDTDGCVFTHTYKVKGKVYSYKKLSFTSRSEPLRQSVFQILENLGIRVRLDNGYDVRIDSREAMEKYFQIVGSHNPKHLQRYQN